MDRELRTALRAIRSSGRDLEIFEEILSEASWDTIIKTQEIVHRNRKAFHGKRIIRAFSLPENRLRGFRLAIQLPGNFPEVDMVMESVTRTETTLLFKAELKIEHPMTTTAVALYDETGFCFGLRPYSSGSIGAGYGDILKMDYRLEMNNGTV